MADRPFSLRWLILLGALAAASLALFSKLSHDAYLRGADAYYYALQVDHWARTGHVRIADSAWIFPLLGLLQRLGPSTETVLRGFTCACLFLASLAVWWGEREAPVFRRTVAALWISLSPAMLFTAIEFPKMFAVMALLPLWNFTRDRRKMLVSAAAMILALWMHRSTTVLLAGFGVGCWLDRKNDRKIVAVVTVGLLVCVGLFLGDRSLAVDLRRFLPSAILSEPGLFSLVARDSLPLGLKIELVFAAAAFAFLLLQKVFRPESTVPFRYVVPGLLAFLPWGSDEVFSVGERLALFLPLLTLLIWCRSGKRSDDERIPAALAVFVCAASLFAGARLNLSHPVSLDPDVPALARATQSLAGRELPMLITHKTLAYYYKYATHAEAFPYEPEDHWNKQRVWRLLYRIRPDEIWAYLNPECQEGLEAPKGEYFLLREDCWETARGKINEEEDSDLYRRAWSAVWNPSLKRPSFLYPKHESDEPGEFPALPPKANQ